MEVQKPVSSTTFEIPQKLMKTASKDMVHKQEKPEESNEVDKNLTKVKKEETKEEELQKKKEDLAKKVDGLNDFLQVKYTNLHFKVHDELDRYYVQVVEKGTDKVVREIPSEEFLNMFSKMMDYMGMIIDVKA